MECEGGVALPALRHHKQNAYVASWDRLKEDGNRGLVQGALQLRQQGDDPVSDDADERHIAAHTYVSAFGELICHLFSERRKGLLAVGEDDKPVADTEVAPFFVLFGLQNKSDSGTGVGDGGDVPTPLTHSSDCLLYTSPSPRD